jgi:hypothetical protein
MNEITSGQEELQSIQVPDGAIRALEKTRGWVSFLGIVSIIGACFFGLMLLIGLGLLAARGMAGIPLVIEGAILVTITILYAIYWMSYSRSLKQLSTEEGLDRALEEAFVRQRRLWTFQGVLFIIIVALSILAAIVVPLVVNPSALPHVYWP